jgi:hypothetical protein
MNSYDVSSIAEKLSDNAYPGRGILLGLTPDGLRSVAVYFIMGRSVNSRNRVFLPEPDGIRTEAYDPELLKDPSLILYHPVRVCGEYLIVTNGDQTDTVKEYLEKGLDFESALRTRRFEPDGPNWTPRISGLLHLKNGSYKLSILKSADAEGTACLRQTFEYAPLAGTGHFLHTYLCDGDPLPSFEGEPERVETVDDIDAYTKLLWENLNAENKISLFVRFTSLRDGTVQQRIVNKNT